VTLNAIMAALVAELRAGGIPNPLGESFTLAAMWDDLARLAGEAPPAEVAALFEAPITPADFFVRPAWVAADVRRRGLSC
jgi:hypothetical protein